jgi:hypothetical protein
MPMFESLRTRTLASWKTIELRPSKFWGEGNGRVRVTVGGVRVTVGGVRVTVGGVRVTVGGVRDARQLAGSFHASS